MTTQASSYAVVSCGSLDIDHATDKFLSGVREYLERGYVLLGGVSSDVTYVPGKGEFYFYSQALVKEVVEEETR